MATETKTQEVKTAKASCKDVGISTKHCIEICRALRYKNTTYAKKYLEEVSEIKRAVPMLYFHRNIAHKKGMSSGRFPEKAAKVVLKLIQAVEANAQNLGMDISELKITRILANRAAQPYTGGRHRRGTKSTHLEIEVGYFKNKKKQTHQEKKTEKVSVEKVKKAPQHKEEKK